MAVQPLSTASAEDLLRRGKVVEALAAAEAVLQLTPEDSRAHIVRVNAANALGDLARTVDSLGILVRRHPLNTQFPRLLATALNNRGSASRRRGDRAAAVADFQRAIGLDPAHPQAWFNLAVCLRDLGEAEAALAAFTRHLTIQPDDSAAQVLAAGLDHPDRAEQTLNQLDKGTLARLDPSWLAHTAARAGLIAASADALKRVDPTHDLDAATEALCELRLRGEVAAIAETAPHIAACARAGGRHALRAELVGALSLPAIYTSEADLLEHRERFARGLEQLHESWRMLRLAPGEVPLRELAHSNFLLAYQGLPDRTLQTRFASLIEGAARALQPALAEPPARHGGRPRVGLLSACWRNCTVGSYFGAWIRWLCDAGLEVFLYQIGPQRDGETDRLAADASTFRFLEGSIESIARRVHDDRLDLLIYPEIGMDARLTPLAALRLAPHQAVAWGHPTTSGFSSIDTYLSCAAMEPAGAQQHYQEALLSLPGLGVDYLLPALPERCPPGEFGLDPRRPRILVPQSLFKLHPDSDRVLAGIASRLRDVQFVLFEPEYPQWRERYLERLGKACSADGVDIQRHVRFLPLAKRPRYLQANLACDLMLDSLHWSGGNTTIDALNCSLPVVTCPGALMRGRQSSAMLERLGLGQSLVADSPGDLVQRVAALATDTEQRLDIGNRIRRHLPDLFDATQARSAFCAWAIEAAGRA